jgi:RNA polymerase sigma-70 factor (ECF subfamily)
MSETSTRVRLHRPVLHQRDPLLLRRAVEGATSDSAGWLRGAKEGDGEAWRQLFRLHHPSLLRYLSRQGARSIEDAAAEVWRRALQGIGTLAGDEDEAAFRGWLITIAHHHLVDQHRWYRRRVKEEAGEVPDRPDLAATPEDAAAVGAEREWLLAQIARLPSPQAEVVRLRYLGELSAPEIAKVLGLTAAAVRQALRRGLARLSEEV